MMRAVRLIAAMLSIGAFCAPVAVRAQQIPVPATVPAPSYAKPLAPSGEETIVGRVDSYDGKYRLIVRDDRGFIDTVDLHQGTIINPTGLRLRSGMRVTILGINRGRIFAANEIDTPYRAYGFGPDALYAGYPVYSLGVGFGPGYHHYWH